GDIEEECGKKWCCGGYEDVFNSERMNLGFIIYKIYVGLLRCILMHNYIYSSGSINDFFYIN
ncbi:hypothetical protein, partial [Bacteroides congonensis]|uniref:hypothetical protein n=1 Tax=Bacteroides congonensis TaxID=1871006 RepID=UPI002648A23D